MTDYQTYKISPTFKIHVLPYARGFELSDDQKAEIHSIWHHEQEARAHKLFNGKILNFVSLEQDLLTAEFIDYQFYLAQLRNPHFEPLLQIKAVCVSGITRAGDKLLVGLRSMQVTQYQQFYESVPSGGIDPIAVVDDQIDVLRQIEMELWEETGISVTEVKQIDPFALIYDPVNRTYNLCAEIHVNYSILNDPRQPTAEYQQFQWMPKSTLKKIIKEQPQNFVPLSLFILKARHLA